MEEPSNGKLAEIPRVESEDKEKQVVVTEDSGELKTEDESVTASVVEGNSESVNENHDGSDSSSSSSSDEEAEPNEKTPQAEDSGEEKKVVTVSVVDSVNHEVPQSEELNDGEKVAVVQIVEAPEDVTLFDSNGVSENVSKEESKINDEAATLPSSDENEGISSAVTEVVPKVIEEIKLPSADENGEDPVPVPVAINDEESKAIEETKLPGSIQNTGEPSYTVDKESKEEVNEESSSALADSGNTGNTANVHEAANKSDISASNANSPIISLSHRTVRPTSWRSCCGLFEVLRHSDS